jgi:hypothetical protein
LGEEPALDELGTGVILPAMIERRDVSATQSRRVEASAGEESGKSFIELARKPVPVSPATGIAVRAGKPSMYQDRSSGRR